MITLPIDALESELIAKLKTTSTVILQAPPGSGKTTRVPQFLLRHRAGKIIVLEPRRLAARLSAERVAEELGETIGQSVGYQIRYEKVIGPDTRLIFMTEGLFLRTILANPTLEDVDCVILDEFHERHMHSDIALALTRTLQRHHRESLKLIVMSATLDTQKLQDKLSHAVVLKADVPTFPIDVEYDTAPDERPLEWRVAMAVESLLQDRRCPGDILVFLSGAADIRRAALTLSHSKFKAQFDLFELRADMPPSEQKLVFLPHDKRKVILSTNVAETSVTLPGVTGVVDSGIAKVASYAHWNGLPSLDIKNISQSSAIQRSGRAGRTAPGVARRLFTRADFQSRTFQEKPEIQRIDLTQVMLEMMVAGKKILPHGSLSFEDYEWIDPPNEESTQAARKLLMELNALSSDGMPTDMGEKLSKWPLHPRLGRILEESRLTGRLREGCLLVSLLNEGLLLKRTVHESSLHTDCDLHYQAQLFKELRDSEQRLSRSQKETIDVQQFKRIERSFESLCHLAQIRKNPLDIEPATPQECGPYARELLAGFPDRLVALRKNKNSSKVQQEAVFSRGGLGQLALSSTVQDSSFAIALQAEQVRRQGAAHFITEITCASGLSSRSIQEHFAPQIRKESSVVWDDQAERVRGVERTWLESLMLEDRPAGVDLSVAEQELFLQLKSKWPRPFSDDTAVEFFNNKLKLFQQRFPQTETIDLRGEDFEVFLVHICEGKKSFAEILENDLQNYIDSFIPWSLKEQLERELPAKWTLGSGRKVEVHYVAGQPPWLASRIQDFFGTLETPRLLMGTLPVTVHLLAPNGQAVQVTTDLANFWKNTYPDVKKEMQRRYPRHYWPDDPKTAEPLTRRLKPNQTPANTSRSK